MLKNRVIDFQGKIYFWEHNEIINEFLSIVETFSQLIDSKYLDDQELQNAKLAILNEAHTTMVENDYILMSDALQSLMLPLLESIHKEEM